VIEIRWERPLHQRGERGAYVVAGDAVVTHERGTRLVCLEAADGTVRWDVPFGTWPRALVVDGDDVFALPQLPSSVHSFSLATGERRWSVDLPWPTGHLAVTRDAVLVGGWRAYTPLRALDRETGRPRWLRRTLLGTVCPAPVAGGFLAGATGTRKVRLLGAANGRTARTWKLPESIPEADHLPVFTVIGTDKVVARCGPGSLAELDLTTGATRELVRHEQRLTDEMPCHAGGFLWCDERRGTRIAVDPASGQVVRRLVTEERFVGDVVEVPGGFLTANAAGMLEVRDAAGELTGRSTVSRRIADLRAGAPSLAFAHAKGTLIAVAATA
jgi:outer membrane protein assembly factor BamB